MKRWKCRDCGCIYTARPSGYFPRLRHSIPTILDSLKHKVKHSRWLGHIRRQTQQYWYRIAKKILSVSGNTKTLTEAVLERLKVEYFRYFNSPQKRAIEHEILRL